MNQTVLVVDDDVAVTRALVRLLKRAGYDAISAASGPEALDVLAKRAVAAIVCDYQMPRMNGDEVLEVSTRLRPDTVRIMLTGCRDLSTAQNSINRGKISHLLLKPWHKQHILDVVRQSVDEYNSTVDNQLLHELTRNERDELEQEVSRQTHDLRMAYEDTLKALVVALDAREKALAGHSRRVAMYALYLSLRLGLPDDLLEDLYRGSLLHDIGKVGVPDSVLLKPGKLTPDERAVIETHVTIGAEILSHIGYLQSAEAIPLYHHERFDGQGYTERLAGEQIPLQARIFAIVDVYDALRSPRPYKGAIGHVDACAIIRAESGCHFDPHVADEFLAIDERQLDQLAEASLRTSHFLDMLAVCRQMIRSQGEVRHRPAA